MFALDLWQVIYCLSFGNDVKISYLLCIKGGNLKEISNAQCYRQFRNMTKVAIEINTKYRNV